MKIYLCTSDVRKLCFEMFRRKYVYNERTFCVCIYILRITANFVMKITHNGTWVHTFFIWCYHSVFLGDQTLEVFELTFSEAARHLLATATTKINKILTIVFSYTENR